MPDDRAAADPPRRLPHLLAAIVCVLLAIGCSVHAWLAVRGKSATFDEPVHALSAWLIVNRGDFRVNPEHPPLWKYLAGLPLIGFPLAVDLDAPAARGILQITERQWWWTVDALYRTPGNDGIALVDRARTVMALLPMLLALVVARWAWAIAGPVAAIVAAVLLTLDPTLLAHGALVTNDVAATLVITLATYLTWRLGQRFTWRRAVGWTLVCAAGIGVKFTCVLLAPMLGVPLLIRAIWPARVAHADVATSAAFPERRGRNVLRLLLLGTATASVAYAMIWGLYRFRVAPTTDGQRFDAGYARRLDAYYSIQRDAALRGQPMADRDIRRAIPTHVPSPSIRLLGWAQDHEVIPQAFSHGLLYARGRSQVRPAFLMEQHLAFGSPLYFPLAVAFKTPVTTLGLAAVALLLGLAPLWSALRRSPAVRWTALCLAVPPMIYLAAAMGSGLNIGVRHVLPILPPIYVAIGITAAFAVRRLRGASVVLFAAGVALAIEVVGVFPNYLPYFNAPNGGARGGLRLLSDSNLDWGQDLPALADWHRDWRRANPKATFFLSYFGTVEPRAYGIDYVNALPGYPFATQPAERDLVRPGGGVFAISASALQGLFDANSRDFVRALRAEEPLDVINGTIYLYALPEPRPAH